MLRAKFLTFCSESVTKTLKVHGSNCSVLGVNVAALAKCRNIPRRHLNSANSDSEPPKNAAEDAPFDNPGERPYEDVYLTETGEEILRVDGSEDLENDDVYWQEFERRFGITDEEDDTIDPDLDIQIKTFDEGEKFELFESSRGLEEVVEFSEPIQREKAKQPQHTVTTELSSSQPQKVAPTLVTPSSVNFESSHDSNEPAIAILRHLALEMDEDSRLTQERQREERRIADPPANKKRPGYERRVQSMQGVMERIVVDLLCKSDSEWYAEGGDVSSVLLSPNMRNLTVYYKLDETTRRSDAWWRKMQARTTGEIRAALAGQLETKYVPRVYLERVGGADDNEKSGAQKELDTLFEQIHAEREGRVSTSASPDIK